MPPDDINMDHDTVVARLRVGAIVTCDHNTFEAATRTLAAEGHTGMTPSGGVVALGFTPGDDPL